MDRGSYGHDEAGHADVGRKPFSDTGEFPEDTEEPADISFYLRPRYEGCCGGVHVLVFARVNHTRDHFADIGAGADEEEDNEEQSVEIEERRLQSH
jgi:hypothetical protein